MIETEATYKKTILGMEGYFTCYHWSSCSYLDVSTRCYKREYVRNMEWHTFQSNNNIFYMFGMDFYDWQRFRIELAIQSFDQS